MDTLELYAQTGQQKVEMATPRSCPWLLQSLLLAGRVTDPFFDGVKPMESVEKYLAANTPH